MTPEQVHQDVKNTDSVEDPFFVLVQHGRVIARFGPGQAAAATSTAYRMTETEGMHVDVYEVDQRLPSPPPMGTLVDPASLGWVDVN